MKNIERKAKKRCQGKGKNEQNLCLYTDNQRKKLGGQFGQARVIALAAMSMRLKTGGGSATTKRLAKKIGRKKSRLVREEKTRNQEGDVSK